MWGERAVGGGAAGEGYGLGGLLLAGENEGGGGEGEGEGGEEWGVHDWLYLGLDRDVEIIWQWREGGYGCLLEQCYAMQKKRQID